MVLKICGISLIAVIMITVFLKNDSGMSFAVSVSAALIIIFSAVNEAKPLIGFFSEQYGRYEYTDVLFKSFGIGLTASFSASLCRECHAESLAVSLELFAKIEIIVLCLPLFASLLSLCRV